jgi:glycerophosphoryl diester phosphodiesterase
MDWDTFREERRRAGRPFVVAHRGAQLAEPENTLRAFLLALVQGADALETDLRFTADDQLILFHDPTLERTTEGAGPVRDHSPGADQGAAHAPSRRPSSWTTACRRWQS